MGRAPRGDGPGVWHHVMNRGIARRTAFEGDQDVRYFLSRIALAVRARWIRLHAYSVLTTHFHLLVRSVGADLSHAMERVLNEYVRWFNRSRERDGPLFRGRFQSRPVESLEYRRRLVSYIDNNAVAAGLVPTPALYPHGSARHYARLRGPPWLERCWIEEDVCLASGQSVYDPRAYCEHFGGRTTPGLARVVERRIALGSTEPDPLDDLLGAAPERVLERMRRKALVADGTGIGLPVCDADDVSQLVASARAMRGDWEIALSRKRSCGWRLLEVALLRDMCACSWAEISVRARVGSSAAIRAYDLHSRALFGAADYAETLAALATQAIERCYGPPTFARPAPTWRSAELARA